MPIIAAVDALSDALRVLRLTGAIFIDSEFTAPWCVLSRSGEPGSPVSGPNIVFFHVLTEGRCKARLLDGGETLDFAAGDLMLLPRDDTHILGSDLRLAPTAADSLVQPAASGELMRIEHGGGGEKTRLICGFLRCDLRLCGPMLESLPRILRVPLGGEAGAAWLTSLLHAGTRESATPRPGGETVLAKLSELLFVEALRRYIELLPGEQKGWLAGLRDRFVGRALALMHERPGHDWTVEELAGRVGASRSSLAQRFSDLLGQAPMQYLTRWRLTIAAQRLRDERVSLARLAEDSGYESEAAFNRAFKRALGATPGAWRKAGRARVVRKRHNPASA
ncbi:MAG TPA: AraC family transcriptional regulator [Burkholderiales bacterium]|nr:AraC family transcriptional regulator [Burkholderiales bacterium]